MIREAAHDQLKTLTACLGDTLLLASAGENRFLFEPIQGVTLEFDPSTPFIHAANLRAILAVFNDVQYINIDERSGRVLCRISRENEAAAGDRPHVLFPKPHTLYLTTATYKDSEGSKIVNDLTQFILHRKQIGFPVSRLDLTKCNMSSYAQDLRALEEVNGLEVVWRRPGVNLSGEESEYCSYICGSGDPQKLEKLPIDRVQL